MVLLLLAGGEAAAQAVLDVDALPPLADGGRSAYRDWLAADFYRAFAVSPTGGWGASSRAESDEEAARQALAACTAMSPAGCRLLAQGNGVFSAGVLQAPAVPDAVIGPFRADPEHLFHGPGKARGALVWSHGTGRSPEVINLYIDPYIRRFSNAGWDVWRFDRAFGDDQLDRTTARLAEGVRLLKQAGYGRVVAAGHSRGGWQSLKALSVPGLLDGVIAAAPAAHGTRNRGTERMTEALAAFEALFAEVPPPAGVPPRVAVFLFTGDPFDPDPPARVAAVRSLGAKRIPYLLLAGPPGFDGHWAAFEPSFDRRYGPCILGFFDQDAPIPCP
jgi:hypothetical protein